ncbi:MAG: DoxX family protein [Gammaproteobacteria bacterium]
MSTIDTHNVPDKGLPLRAGLWLAQLLLVGVYLPTGLASLFLPVAQVLTTVPWAGHVPENVLNFIGVVDLTAGLGVLLPSLTRIAPGLTVLAAVCSAALQVFAILFYTFLGTLDTMLPVNLAVFVLSVFVAWGRSDKAAITPRRQNRRMEAIDVFAAEPADGLRGRRGTRRRAALSHKISSNEGIRIQQGMRGAPFRRAEVQRRFCNE